METILAHRELHIERKYVIIELRENERGKYLKISETAGGRRNIVIIPDTGLNAFALALRSVLGVATAVDAGEAKSPTNDGLTHPVSTPKDHVAPHAQNGAAHAVKDLERRK